MLSKIMMSLLMALFMSAAASAQTITPTSQPDQIGGGWTHTVLAGPYSDKYERSETTILVPRVGPGLVIHLRSHGGRLIGNVTCNERTGDCRTRVRTEGPILQVIVVRPDGVEKQSYEWMARDGAYRRLPQYLAPSEPAFNNWTTVWLPDSVRNRFAGQLGVVGNELPTPATWDKTITQDPSVSESYYYAQAHVLRRSNDSGIIVWLHHLKVAASGHAVNEQQVISIQMVDGKLEVTEEWIIEDYTSESHYRAESGEDSFERYRSALQSLPPAVVALFRGYRGIEPP